MVIAGGGREGAGEPESVPGHTRAVDPPGLGLGEEKRPEGSTVDGAVLVSDGQPDPARVDGGGEDEVVDGLGARPADQDGIDHLVAGLGRGQQFGSLVGMADRDAQGGKDPDQGLVADLDPAAVLGHVGGLHAVPAGQGAEGATARRSGRSARLHRVVPGRSGVGAASRRRGAAVARTAVSFPVARDGRCGP